MRAWTCAEEEALRVLGPVLGGPACAQALDRPYTAVRRRAANLGVKLHRSKDLVTIGSQSAPAVVRRVRELHTAPLCPVCARRYVGVRQTGLCGPCHLERLTTIHEEEIAKADAQLNLWAARSKLLRRRRTLAEADALAAAETGDAGATMETEDATDSGEATCTP